MFKSRAFGLSTLLMAVLALVPQARADDFYKGKLFTIVVGFSPAGGYDNYARVLSRYIGSHIPGNPTVIVQNMPGAGSLTSVRYLNLTAPKDGTVMVIFNPGMVTQSIVQPEKIGVDFRQYAWVGVVTPDYRVCYSYGEAGPKTWDEMMHRKEFILGSTGKSSGNYINGATLRLVFHAPVKQIMGYPGSAEQRLAIEQGALDGDCGSYSSIPLEWIDKKPGPFLRPLHPPARRRDPRERRLYRHLCQGRRAATAAQSPQRRRRSRPAIHHVEGGAGGSSGDHPQGVRRHHEGSGVSSPRWQSSSFRSIR